MMHELANFQVWKSTKSDRPVERTIIEIFINRNDKRVIAYTNYNGITRYEEHEDKFQKWIALQKAELKPYVSPTTPEPEQVLIKKDDQPLVEILENKNYKKPEEVSDPPKNEVQLLSSKLDKLIETILAPKPKPKENPFYFPLLRPNERTSVYIDGPNFYYACNALNVKFNYTYLYEYLVRRTHLVRCHYYSTIMEESDGYKSILPLIEYLQYNNYYVFTRENFNHNQKNDIDADLIVDVMNHAYRSKLDHIILFSGDRDYLRMVKSVQELGIKVTVVSTFSNGSISEELRKAADSFVDLKNFIHAFEYKE